MDLLNTDDSDQDAHYIPDEDFENLLSSEEDEPRKKRKRVSKIDSRPCTSNNVNESSIMTKELHGEDNFEDIGQLGIMNEEVIIDIPGNTVELDSNEQIFDTDQNIDSDFPLTKRGTLRKRGLKGESRKIRAERKELRNKGYEYKNKSGKTIEAKKSLALEQCRNKCSEKVSNYTCETLFKEYWGMGSYDRRCTYMAGLLELQNTKRNRTRNEDGNNHFRQISIKYNIEHQGVKSVVCKSCFIKIFGESKKTIENIVQKKRANCSGIVQPDQRGHFQKTCLSESTISAVREFLSKIPAYESHYSRRDCGKKFVSPHLTITSIYEEYKSTLMNQNSKPVSYRKFCDEFHDLNLKIKKPKIDTCPKCDSLTLQIKITSDLNKEEFVKKLDDHHKDSEYAYDAKKSDKEKSKHDSTCKVVTFDMQQCLPTPLVQNSVAFYKRQLWTFNLTVYDCDEGVTYCYLWHEGIAARGANEIGSCVYTFIMNDLKADVKSLTMYSDTCGGQNKNTHVAAMCIVAVLQSPSLEEINHKFLVPGHTHMECDTSHALIERNKKHFNGNIHHPHDWAQLIQNSGKKNPFKVKEMTQAEFFDFAKLLKGDLQQRKEDVVGNPFSWRLVQWLQYKKETPGVIFFKTSLDPYQPFQCVSFTRRGKETICNLIPSLRYNKPNPIPEKKKSDILDLFPFISPIFHPFYENLKTSADLVDTYPDDNGEEDENTSEQGIRKSSAKKKKRTSKK